MKTKDMFRCLNNYDNSVSIMYSAITDKYYVSSKIEIKRGVILEGGAPHMDTPKKAIRAYFEGLIGSSRRLEGFILKRINRPV